MTTNETIRSPIANQWSNRQWLLIVIMASLAAGSLGFWVSDRRLDRLAQESGQKQVEEFVKFCDKLGVLDKKALDEALITASEAQWEDRDAADRQEGVNP